MYHFSWVQLAEPALHALEGLGMTHDDAIDVISSWLICFFLLAFALMARAALGKAIARGGTEAFIPDPSLGIRNIFELYTEGIYNLVAGVLGNKDARTYYWLLGGMFLYIFVCNLLSVLPGGLPPTDNISNNWAMSGIVLIVYVVEGVRRTGLVFFKHMMGPVLWLAPLIFVIEALGVFFVRPFSLSVRLTGNIFGDHLVFGIMSDLVPILVPSIFLGLGIFVSFLQAFVFTLLTSVYISLSVDHGEDH